MRLLFSLSSVLVVLCVCSLIYPLFLCIHSFYFFRCLSALFSLHFRMRLIFSLNTATKRHITYFYSCSHTLKNLLRKKKKHKLYIQSSKCKRYRGICSIVILTEFMTVGLCFIIIISLSLRLLCLYLWRTMFSRRVAYILISFSLHVQCVCVRFLGGWWVEVNVCYCCYTLRSSIFIHYGKCMIRYSRLTNIDVKIIANKLCLQFIHIDILSISMQNNFLSIVQIKKSKHKLADWLWLSVAKNDFLPIFHWICHF